MKASRAKHPLMPPPAGPLGGLATLPPAPRQTLLRVPLPAEVPPMSVRAWLPVGFFRVLLAELEHHRPAVEPCLCSRGRPGPKQHSLVLLSPC